MYMEHPPPRLTKIGADESKLCGRARERERETETKRERERGQVQCGSWDCAGSCRGRRVQRRKVNRLK